jgi:hypothetical protein
MIRVVVQVKPTYVEYVRNHLTINHCMPLSSYRIGRKAYISVAMPMYMYEQFTDQPPPWIIKIQTTEDLILYNNLKSKKSKSIKSTKPIYSLDKQKRYYL